VKLSNEKIIIYKILRNSNITEEKIKIKVCQKSSIVVANKLEEKTRIMKKDIQDICKK
jgi:hypothetical protein